MPQEGSLRLILEDETGKEREYEMVGTFTFEERDYMGLLPVESPEDGVILFGFHAGEADEIVLDTIEDDEEYQRAAEAFEDIFNQNIPIETFEVIPEDEFDPEEYGLDEDLDPDEYALEDEFDLEEYDLEDGLDPEGYDLKDEFGPDEDLDLEDIDEEMLI